MTPVSVKIPRAAPPGPPMARPSAQARIIHLARRIAEIAAREDWPADRHVTEAELCAALAVSRTPVRAALRLLEGQGLMRLYPGRGFFLTEAAGAGRTFDAEAPPSAEDTLFVRILRDRAAGTLPADTTRGQLLSRYAAGRVVLERVILRLVDDGLLRNGGGRTLHFAASLGDVASLAASYEIRLAVEPAALLVPDFRVDPDALALLRARHDAALTAIGQGLQGDAALRRLVTLDTEFHQTLVGWSGNPFMVAVARQQGELRRLLEFTANEDRARVRQWLAEHLGIIEALERREPEQAAERLRAHLAQAFRAALPASDPTREE